MHAKSGLRVVLELKIYRPDSVIADVIQTEFMRMPRFSLKIFLLAVAAICLCFPFVWHYYSIDRFSIGMQSVGRAALIPDGGFRVTVLYHEASNKAKIVSIENCIGQSADGLTPSFAYVKMSDSRATMYINDKPVVPQDELVAYFAKSGGNVRRTILKRSEYLKIAPDGIFPSYSDQDLWDLCVESATID